ncbi:hypothetical protein F511_06624 [Dorcoceras hygrometricum]|uniref:Uncharacterized protein n=1 Tax=Dorcoceras hygrometricum TaxID=472368 RepID=A0A2Z7AQG2_9LAMI|nr:hypothetical protein F511_06624 [Dorcoceras hygrometricum]
MELQKRMAELEMIKDNLKQAKDDATQSWLDSRPLIDELETMQAELSSAKDRVAKAEATIFELQAQLETINTRIQSAKEGEERCHVMISDINQAQHKTQEEMEQHKAKTDDKRRRKSKLKQVLRLKKQTLEALELTLEAIKLESEAFGTSAAQALHHINNSEATNIMMELSQEEYNLLKKRASEQISTAEWRISVSQEEKLAAENTRDSAFARLQKLNPSKGYTPRNIDGRIVGEEDMTTKPAKVKSPAGRGVDKKNVNTTKPNDDKTKNKNYLVKRKTSVLVRIKTFFVRKLSKYFN